MHVGSLFLSSARSAFIAVLVMEINWPMIVTVLQVGILIHSKILLCPVLRAGKMVLLEELQYCSLCAYKNFVFTGTFGAQCSVSYIISTIYDAWKMFTY